MAEISSAVGEQPVGVFDFPGDQPTQRGFACPVGFLGIGPGRAEEGLGRIVALELGQALDRGDADAGFGVLGRLDKAARKISSPLARSSTISRLAGIAFSRFQAAASALAASGLSLAVLTNALRGVQPAQNTRGMLELKQVFFNGLFEVELLDQPARGSIWTILGLAAAGITNSCEAPSITIGMSGVLQCPL